MDNLRDYVQSGLIQVERREHRFERAAITLVSEFGASHVECDFIRLGVGRVADLSFRIDKLTDEPGACKPIDMGARPRDPALASVLGKRDRGNRRLRRGPFAASLLGTTKLW